MSAPPPVDAAAHAPVLLVASDYDGTLAPIVDDPAAAHPHREALVALRNLAKLPRTHVAVISGRALADLAGFVGEPGQLHLVGSHGSEFEPDFLDRLPDDARQRRDGLERRLAELAAQLPGAAVEPKPASVAFHYRNADAAAAAPVVEAVRGEFSGREGFTEKRGKKVLEYSVVDTHKGHALERLRARVGATHVVFLGDDVTDEDGFAVLGGPDLDIKVGGGETRARHRLDDPAAVARLLAQLCEERTAWLMGAKAVPIDRLAFLSDQRSGALLGPDGRVVWMCAPRLDSPALFAELLGDAGDGHFAVTPAGASDEPQQAWLGDSLVLRTWWPQVELLDALDASGGRPEQRPGRCDLLRVVRVQPGHAARVAFAPRLDYGRQPTRLRAEEGGLRLEGSFDPVVLASPGVRWEIHDEGPHHTAVAELAGRDEPWVLELRYGSGSLEDRGLVPERIRRTRRWWEGWVDGLELPGEHRELLARSALVLRGLCHGPTGAIAAAATTSLPEQVGGVRNWDYRYSWLRDGAMSALALVELGSTSEGLRFLDWVLGIVEESPSPDRLAPVYALDGRPLPPEAEIASLSGYMGSRPVRVGNAASMQLQLDVFGPVVELVERLLRQDAPLGGEHWRLVRAMVEAVAARWQEPDHGIWEVRTGLRHHVHSKLMCWLTVDRALTVAEHFDPSVAPAWRELRTSIRDDILERGVSPEGVRAFYGSDEADASVLLVGLKGLLEPTDPVFLRTAEWIDRALREGPTVYRYRYEDGLPGHEGGWHLCASWLVQSWCRAGQRDRARELFASMVELAGPLGLYSEQYDPAERRALGNHPQAFSHIGLIEAALCLERG